MQVTGNFKSGNNDVFDFRKSKFSFNDEQRQDAPETKKQHNSLGSRRSESSSGTGSSGGLSV